MVPNDDCSSVQCESFETINNKVKEKFKDY